MMGHDAAAPARLSEDVVRRRLDRLPEWSGDGRQLSRTLERPTDELQKHLQVVLDLSPHGGYLWREDGRLVITLRTEASRGVTAYDIALAQRIDDVLIDARPQDSHGDQTVEVHHAGSTSLER